MFRWKKMATFPFLKYPAFSAARGFSVKQLKQTPAPSPHVRTPFCRWPESWEMIGGGKGLVVGGLGLG